jgi:6-phosphofructokinase
VTCGGLSTGTNTVVRELVVGLWELYGVRAIFGVRNGYRGFYSEEEEEPLPLEPATVHHWHKVGGTVLGTSRGEFDLARIVDAIGGDVGIIDRSFGFHTASPWPSRASRRRWTTTWASSTAPSGSTRQWRQRSAPSPRRTWRPRARPTAWCS